MAEPALELRDVSASYGHAQALFDISLHVNPAEMVGLLGRNGAGKSSTFNAVMNLELRRTGHIRALGASLDGVAPDAIARSGVAWVPENRRVFPTLTVRENIDLARMGAKSRGGGVPIDELVEAFPLLKHLLNRRGNHLSGGEQQVVAVARALAGRPQVLLLDEPTEGLAPVVVDQLTESIRRLPETLGVAVLLAEQNLEFVLGMTSRVYVLETGRVVHAGSTDEFARDDALQRRYLSVAASGVS
jgi:branched-chain amino acid transport system ATP-binding protein